MEEEIDKYLRKFYYDAKAPASFSGATKLWQYVKKRDDKPKGLTFKKIKKWYELQLTHVIHKQPVTKFPREKIIMPYMDHQWDSDLIAINNLRKYNSNYSYIIVFIDLFSRFAWATPLKQKTGGEVKQAIEKVFASGRKCEVLRSDAGKEYCNRIVEKFLKEENVHHIVAFSQHKASYAERFNLTIQQKLYKYLYEHQTYRYVDILQDVVDSYNATSHSSIGMAPKDVNEQNEYELYEKVYMPILIEREGKPPQYKFSVGEYVRLSYQKWAFKRSYKQQYTEEIFQISARIPSHPPRYKLQDTNGKIIKGSFYEQEMQKANVDNTTLFKIAKVHRNKKKKINGITYFLVSWAGYSREFDSYVSQSEIKSYTGIKP